jgi:hypothetical protein
MKRREWQAEMAARHDEDCPMREHPNAECLCKTA